MRYSRMMALCAGLAAGVLVLAAPVVPAGNSAVAAPVTTARCHLAWSHYVGWEPYGYIQSAGVAKKWGAKYHVDLTYTLINDYVESINQYTAGQFDGVAVTTMDGLANPAVGNVDTTVLTVGDYSNGNDGILINGKPGVSVKDLKGKSIKLVQYSVSNYLLDRALDKAGLTERDVTVVNASDADLGSLIATSKANDAFVTWNPILMNGRMTKGIQMVFDSSKIQGEIIDTMMVATKVSDGCKKAATGAWYEVMGLLRSAGPAHDALIKKLAAQSGGTEAEFNAQLRTTYLYADPAAAAKFAESAHLKQSMAFAAKFSFDHGLYGKMASDSTFVGIQYPDGSVWGNKANVKLRFTSAYMKLAAAGKL